MPEGDAVHRVARRLQVLVGDELEVETPHPRAAVKQLAPLLDGRRLEAVEAVGKNLLLRFDAEIFGVPWLVLRGEQHMGVLSGGAVLELDRGVARRIGPDILAEPPDFDAMVRNLRAIEQSREIGDALLDQRLIGGIGNVWKVESLWAERVSPWLPLADVPDDALGGVLLAAHRLMRNRLDGVRVRAQVYRKKERPCPRCGTPIRSWPQGDQARMAYWCPQCQRGAGPRMK